MFSSDEYIKENAPAIVKNAIVRLLWQGKNPIVSIDEQISAAVPYCDKENYRETAMEILRKCSNPGGLKKLIDTDRHRLVSPYYRTAKDYIAGEFETTLTLQQISSEISANI